MSVAPTKERPAPVSPGRASKRSNVTRSALLALMVYFLGLGPFYFLTPVRESLASMLARPFAVGSEPGRRTSATPSAARIKAKTGADVVSVAAPTAEADAAPASIPAEASADPRYAFLLLGYGGAGHDGAFLTDSMMVVVVNPEQKSLILLSIPRDAWVPLLFDGRTAVYNKINTAYAFALDDSLFPERLARYQGDPGAGLFATDTVSRLLGVPIRYYLGLDFSGFRQMIDAVGGIDVDVPATFSARYPANDDPSIDASWMTVRFTEGLQHMGGERAIEFARAREAIDNVDEGSDFARSRRQRLIIEAFKARVIQPGGLLHLPQLIGIGSQHVATNYAFPEVAKLSQLILDWHDVHIYQTALTTQNFLEDATGPEGTYATVPSSPSHSWAQVRAFVRRLWQDPATGVALAQTRLVVDNDTGVAGAATRVSAVLAALGYSVDAPTAGISRDGSRLVDTTGQHLGTVLAAALQKDLGIDSLDVVEEAGDVPGSVTLQLGATDLKAASLVATADTLAPASSVGIERFGTWAPESDSTTGAAPALVTPSETPRRAPSATRVGTPAREGGTPVPTASRGTATPVESPSRPTHTPRPAGTPTPAAPRTPTPRST